MLRVISLFLLLIISQISFADTIPATPLDKQQSALSACKSIPYTDVTDAVGGSGGSIINVSVFNIPNASQVMCSVSYTIMKWGRLESSSVTLIRNYVTLYTCPSGYTQSDSSGNPDSSGQNCSKSACADSAGTSINLWVNVRNTPLEGCFAGCKIKGGYNGVNVSLGDPLDLPRYEHYPYTFTDESCSGVFSDVDDATAKAANDAYAKAKALEDAKAACGSAGYDIGTANGETVVTCKVPDSPPPSTDTGSSTGTDSTSSGMGTDAGSPETNTSGTQNSTVGGGTGSLGGSGYGQGGTSGGGTGSGGTSGGDTGSGGTSGGDTGSGGTSGGGTGSGGTSGGDTGSGTGTGGETEEESDESGSYPGTDSSFDYADTDRETRTVTDVFKENYEKFKSTELVSSATGFFTVNLSGGACSVIQFDIFGSAVSFDPCAFLEYITSLMRIAVLFACTFFAFRIAME